MPYLKKALKDNKEVIKGHHFPLHINKYQCKNNIALIGVGGNIGDSIRRFERLLVYLQRSKLLKVVATSIIFKNPPFGYLEQPYFYNTLIVVESRLSALSLLRFLQRVEKRFGRKREFANAPRTLDLDIILYNKRKITKEPTLIVPHPHWRERESVLLPLKYLKGAVCLQRVL
jgi:2-amino-4-hydroxy-6-hydroxymethyldihydropteridine diphosphokinase